MRPAGHGTGKPATRINRADSASLLVDAVGKGAWIRQAPLVRNARS